jgi:hypothetical protein
MHLKTWSGRAALLLMLVLTACNKPQAYLADPREDLKGLGSKVYSVELNTADVQAIKTVFLTGIMGEISSPPSDEKYGNAKILDQDATSFRLRATRKHVVWGMPPPDLEVRFFIEKIPGQPDHMRANAYLVAIQNPGPDEVRYSLAGVGMMDESVADRFVRDFFPIAKQKLETK